MPQRPRLLLVPSLSELEWGRIRPLLAEWTEVAAYDLPGLGEPQPERLSRDLMVARGVRELEQQGWSEAIIVGDQFGSALAVLVAEAWDGDVRGLALGHACLTGSSPEFAVEVRAFAEDVWPPGGTGTRR